MHQGTKGVLSSKGPNPVTRKGGTVSLSFYFLFIYFFFTKKNEDFLGQGGLVDLSEIPKRIQIDQIQAAEWKRFPNVPPQKQHY